jgi:hypothetical protein
MRARGIKPGFFKNEKLAELPPLARILFIGLWCMADREGRLEDRPKRIRAEILPFDGEIADKGEKVGETVEKLLEMLAKSNDPFIARYEVDGEKYIQIINFLRHQNPHKREAESEIPAIPTKGRPRHNLGTDKAGPRSGPNRDEAQPKQERARLTPSSLTPSSLTPDIPASRKSVFGAQKNVLLTDEEVGKLRKELGEQEADRWIEVLSEGIALKGYKYKSHYLAILKWRKTESEKAKTEPVSRKKPSPAGNFDQRTYSDEYLNGLYEVIQADDELPPEEET